MNNKLFFCFVVSIIILSLQAMENSQKTYRRNKNGQNILHLAALSANKPIENEIDLTCAKNVLHYIDYNNVLLREKDAFNKTPLDYAEKNKKHFPYTYNVILAAQLEQDIYDAFAPLNNTDEEFDLAEGIITLNLFNVSKVMKARKTLKEYRSCPPAKLNISAHDLAMTSPALETRSLLLSNKASKPIVQQNSE